MENKIYGNFDDTHREYVITDPKGQLIKQTGHLLEQGGYKIIVFNTIEL